MSEDPSDPDQYSEKEPSQRGATSSGSKNKEIIVDPEKYEKRKELYLRNEQAAIEEFCRKYNIPIGNWDQMYEKAKERLKLGQTRTASERKELKDREIKVNPENLQTIAAANTIIEEIGKVNPPKRLEPGRIKPSSLQEQETTR